MPRYEENEILEIDILEILCFTKSLRFVRHLPKEASSPERKEDPGSLELQVDVDERTWIWSLIIFSEPRIDTDVL